MLPSPRPPTSWPRKTCLIERGNSDNFDQCECEGTTYESHYQYTREFNSAHHYVIHCFSFTPDRRNSGLTFVDECCDGVRLAQPHSRPPLDEVR